MEDCRILEIIKKALGLKDPRKRLQYLDSTIPWGEKVSLDGLEKFGKLIKLRNETARLVQASEQTSLLVFRGDPLSPEIARIRKKITIAFAEILESRDKVTGEHARRVSLFSETIAKELAKNGEFPKQLSPEYISLLIDASPLHDIGKIAIPDAILNKPEKLTPAEFEVMKTHTTEGKRLIEKIMNEIPDASYLALAAEIAFTHHERWDGKGYPQGLKGEEIPLSGRIVAVADVFDALISERPYKKPYRFEEAITMIKAEEGTHFDPTVTEAFVSAKKQIQRDLVSKKQM